LILFSTFGGKIACFFELAGKEPRHFNDYVNNSTKARGSIIQGRFKKGELNLANCKPKPSNENRNSL
jgi:hypothetical protein